jgi:hypothetical protein
MRRTAVVIAVLLALAACSGDDGDGADSGSAAETTAAGDPADATPELTSPAFADGEAIPLEQAGCDGANVSPALDWTGMPADADQLAITMVDPDADGFVHWVVVGIDPQATGVGAGEVPAGVVEAANDTGESGYFGPCPPETHTYVFTVHALSADPGVTAGTAGGDAVAAVEATTSTSAELSGTYTPAG